MQLFVLLGRDKMLFWLVLRLLSSYIKYQSCTVVIQHYFSKFMFGNEFYFPDIRQYLYSNIDLLNKCFGRLFYKLNVYIIKKSKGILKIILILASASKQNFLKTRSLFFSFKIKNLAVII